MADLILHHYATSPFSEKLRLILGYKKLAWKSVIIPQIAPKPDWSRSPAATAARRCCRSAPTSIATRR